MKVSVWLTKDDLLMLLEWAAIAETSTGITERERHLREELENHLRKVARP